MLMSNLTELLNARHEDLDFELGMLLNNRQLLKEVAPKLDIVSEVHVVVDTLEKHLLDKLDVDLEEVAEDEEVSVEDITTKLIDYSLGEAFNEAKIQLKSYLQMDHMISQIKNLGGTEEEIKGLYSFKDRLENTVFNRYDVTEQDVKGESDE
jgi:hypothetical protein